MEKKGKKRVSSGPLDTSQVSAKPSREAADMAAEGTNVDFFWHIFISL